MACYHVRNAYYLKHLVLSVGRRVDRRFYLNFQSNNELRELVNDIDTLHECYTSRAVTVYSLRFPITLSYFGARKFLF